MSEYTMPRTEAGRFLLMALVGQASRWEWSAALNAVTDIELEAVIDVEKLADALSVRHLRTSGMCSESHLIEAKAIAAVYMEDGVKEPQTATGRALLDDIEAQYGHTLNPRDRIRAIEIEAARIRITDRRARPVVIEEQQEAAAVPGLDVERLVQAIGAGGYESHPDDLRDWAAEIAVEYDRSPEEGGLDDENYDLRPVHNR